MPSDPTRPRAAVIFHGIGRPARPMEPGEEVFWFSRDRFRRILDRIAALPGPGVHVTFDDGNASDIEIALPELAARGLTATFFLLTGRLDRPGSLTSADVTALAAAGQRIGLHGDAHTDWRRLDAAGREAEFRTARRRLAALAGTPVDAAAAPFGRYDRRTVQALRAEGFAAFHTSDWGPEAPHRFIRPRNCLDATMTDERIDAALRGALPVLRRPRRWLGLSRKRLLPLGGLS